MAVYDDEKTKSDDLHNITGISPSEARDMEARAVAGADQDRAAADEKKDLFGDKNENDDTVGKGFTGGGNKGFLGGKIAKLPKKKTSIIVVSLITAGGAGFMSLFGFMNVFKLDHFMSNLEIKSHMRYQVDFDGRSSKFRNAYIKMRLTEVENPSIEPGKRENRIFRADRVDNNKPLTDWYRTLRSNKFEENVFNKEGIKFTSIEHVRSDGSRTIRPAKLEINDKIFELGLTNNEINVLKSGDIAAIDRLNLGSKLDTFITKFDNDQEARKAMKEVIDRNLRPWQVMKRRHIRKDIQNKTGVRSWRFFEKTREKVNDNTAMMRNKIITSSLPEDTKTGKIARCMFGLEECKTSSDPSSPANRASTGNTQLDLGGSDGGSDVDDSAAKGVRKAFFSKVVNKVIPLWNVAETIHMFGEFRSKVNDGGLTKLIVAARTAQAVGLYTTYSVARDQIRTGEVTTEETSQFMNYANNLGNNEAWDMMNENTSIISFGNSKTYAAELEPEANSRKEYCSDEYQEKIENNLVDSSQYAYLCSSQRIGSGSTGQGKLLQTIFDSTPWKVSGFLTDKLYSSPIGDVVGWISGAIGDAFGFIFEQGVGRVLKIAGLDVDGDIKSAVEWVAQKFTNFIGAGPITDTNTPAGVEGNIVAQGAAATAESSMRGQGAAETTDTTRADSAVRIIKYNKEQNENQSFIQRNFALSNPNSIASNQLYAASTSQSLKNPARFVSSIFSSLGSIFQLSGSGHTGASEGDGYILAKIADIDTYDWPKQCIDMDPFAMTPQNATNADDLGLISAEELTWELVRKKESFYDKLYQNEPEDDIAKKVYNCALLDNAVMGSLGAMYGYTDDNAIQTAGSSSEPGSDDSDSGSVSENAKENAKKLLELASSNKIKLDGYSSDPQSDKNDRSMSSLQLEDISNGKKAKLSTRCNQNIPSEVEPDVKILQFLIALAEKESYTINSLFGQCHSSASSNHYKGTAVDFGCPFNTSNGDKVGSRFGVSRNGENCTPAGGNHYHYSVGGR